MKDASRCHGPVFTYVELVERVAYLSRIHPLAFSNASNSLSTMSQSYDATQAEEIKEATDACVS